MPARIKNDRLRKCIHVRKTNRWMSEQNNVLPFTSQCRKMVRHALKIYCKIFKVCVGPVHGIVK